jgi:hypothetical protein
MGAWMGGACRRQEEEGIWQKYGGRKMKTKKTKKKELLSPFFCPHVSA